MLRTNQERFSRAVVHSFDGTSEELKALLEFDNVYIGAVHAFPAQPSGTLCPLYPHLIRVCRNCGARQASTGAPFGVQKTWRLQLASQRTGYCWKQVHHAGHAADRLLCVHVNLTCVCVWTAVAADAPWCGIRPSHAGLSHIKTTWKSVKNARHKPDDGCLVKGRNEPCCIRYAARTLPGAAVARCQSCSHIGSHDVRAASRQVAEVLATARGVEVEHLAAVAYVGQLFHLFYESCWHRLIHRVALVPPPRGSIRYATSAKVFFSHADKAS